ncbi:ABC transporter permease [Lactobacillus pentosus] [Lactiplantibacillus mudanjiangensis]|uniref:ABC transporter permease [Lactobacillus pentosus] n=1 Tax=Lactiplantibacillus mudanjiangensis TaxID=1296538 RepID=A0A660DZY0_9LACO|nr:ABC transporter permease [Lactobacillus pentosus] [Lactiplantibacillus mudanjiangensis]VDG25891.1 ABC transporter permease [Lactobacillus pentosus] [Lactiplantibacillus mudanjiangensis]VDG28677.1 ABC transporter permease [Lactobacillus pentosus] [Lactiplantibacillus mudanjiangensis]
MNFSSQLAAPSMSKMTQLSNVQLFWGNIIYIVIFLALDLMLFRKREV